MTRAKYGTIIVGSAKTLLQDPKWALLIKQLQIDGRFAHGEEQAFQNIAETDDSDLRAKAIEDYHKRMKEL